jgi:asparagine N-glycosylation enzyme membrane subunit Stt3
LFQTDPRNGFPPGVVETSDWSWHAVLHGVGATIVFLALAGALLAFSRAFLERKEGEWALYAIASAALVLALFLSPAGSAGDARVLRLAVLIGWMAASIIALRLSVPDEPPGAAAEPPI